VVVVIAVSVVLDFQRAVIKCIKPSAGEQVIICILRFLCLQGGKVRLKEGAMAVGIVFAAFEDVAVAVVD